MPTSPIRLDPEPVRRLWLELQGLAVPRGTRSLTKRHLADHLERTAGLQLDSIHVVDRAHYLTLWSRFGPYARSRADRLIYEQGVGFEHWGHEASILPMGALPISLRGMRRFPPARWQRSAWWKHYETSPRVQRQVLRRLRDDGPLESADFERRDHEVQQPGPGWAAPLPKEAKRALLMLWHAGRIAVRTRRHFRRVYDLAQRVYPDVAPAHPARFEEHWLLAGLRANGVASEAHLRHYLSAPHADAALRKRVVARHLKRRSVREVEVRGVRGTFLALPEHLERLADAPEAHGTHLLSPFDSLLWQRRRALELLDFHFRVEIYVPPAKREFGYYAMPILHDGRLVGRVDPKLHRDRGELEIKNLRLEPGVRPEPDLCQGLRESLESLAEFTGATDLCVPRAWRRRLG